MSSPYAGVPSTQWKSRTQELIREHPLDPAEIVDIVLRSWEAIFQSRIGPRSFKIGVDIYPKPQILGALLHELIPLELQSRYPRIWRVEATAADKDVVHLNNPRFSFEIKTSSSAGSIFGNRSYAQEAEAGKKDKAGYYLAVNFQKCTRECDKPAVKSIRFGWLDHSDWTGQRAETGQQARLGKAVNAGKLVSLFPS